MDSSNEYPMTDQLLTVSARRRLKPVLWCGEATWFASDRSAGDAGIGAGIGSATSFRLRARAPRDL